MNVTCMNIMYTSGCNHEQRGWSQKEGAKMVASHEALDGIH